MKSILTTALFVLAVTLSLAQTGINLTWEKAFSNSAGASSMVWNSIQHYDNSVIVAGQSSLESGYAMYLARYQSSGLLQWDTTFVTQGESSLRLLTLDNSGNIYVAGSEAIGTFSQLRIHMAKISPTGQVLWHITYNGPGGLYAQVSDMILSGGNLYLCGQQATSTVQDRAWVAKFDTNGNLAWDNTFDPGLDTYLYSLSVDPAGVLTAVGTADEGYSFLVLQYSNNGTLNWQYPANLNGNLIQGLSDVTTDNQGNIYAVGTRESGVFESDIITLKLGPGGNVIWEKNFSNQDENRGKKISIAPNGTIYSAGELSNSAFTLVINYDTAGNVVWTRSYQLGSQTILSDMLVDPSGDIFLAVEEFDSVAVARITASGTIAASKTYGLEQANYLGGISLGGNTVYVAGFGGEKNQSTLFALQATDLQETLRVESFGVPQSDARPNALTADANHVWMSTFSDDGDSAQFAITKVDQAGNVVWERILQYATVIPSFPFLENDGAGNVVGLFQNSKNVDGGQMGLVKYNAAGVEQFVTLEGSGFELNASGLALAPNGDIYVAALHSVLKEMWLSRYNASGVLQWTKTYKSPSATFPFSRPYQMRITPQGKLVIAATHKDAANDNDLHVFQFTADGTLEWHDDVAKQPGNTNSFAGMHILPNGDIIVFGSSSVTGYAAARFSSTGTRIWIHEGTSPFSHAPRSMATDAQGITYLCFSSNSHVYVRQLDASGNLIKDAQFSTPTTGTFYFPRHSTLAGGRLTILGEHLMAGEAVPLQMLVDDQLNLEFIHVDSTTRGQIQAMTVDPAGNLYGVYLTGNLLLSVGARSALLRKYGIGTVGIDPLKEKTNFHIYPNPARDYVHIQMEAPVTGDYSVSVCDIQGRMLTTTGKRHMKAGQAEWEIPLPLTLPDGLYMISVEIEGNFWFRPLLIRR